MRPLDQPALKKRFPHLSVKAMVRGEEVLNDATMEDAEYVGLSEVAEVISNGKAIAGTILGNMTFNTGLFPVVIVVLLWLVQTVTYLRAAKKYS